MLARPPKRVHFSAATADANSIACRVSRPSASARAIAPCQVSPAASVSTALTRGDAMVWIRTPSNHITPAEPSVTPVTALRPPNTRGSACSGDP